MSSVTISSSAAQVTQAPPQPPSSQTLSPPQSVQTHPQPPLRIAILLNSYRSRLLPAIRASYERTIGEVAPEAKLAFYEPANNRDDFPDPAYFDLIVLGGGNVDPRKSHPWILAVHSFLRRTVERFPEKKVLAICWGHQTVSRVFGGEVVDAEFPEMGVATINLTTAGRKFFPEMATLGSFRLQQHHRREVATAPPGFTRLAQGNQCLVNESNTILTFQGHPEKDGITARLRMHDAARWFGLNAERGGDCVDEKAWAKLEAALGAEHDGAAVWRRVLEWVREPAVLGVGLVDRGSRM